MTVKAEPAVDGSPWTFFLLLFVLAIPFWFLGAVTELPEEVPIKLPASEFMFVCPVLAASILAYRDHGADGVGRLVSRALDCRRIRRKRWYVPILFLMPAILVVD